MRTLVFVGGHDRDRVRTILTARPDAVCVDLEDSTPVTSKDRARRDFASLAEEIAASEALVFARVNAPGAGLEEDLDACLVPALHCLSLPKVESGEAVAAFAEQVSAAERRHGRVKGELLIRPIIETPLGVINALEIAAASPRVAYLGGVEGGVFGDLGGALGYVQTEDGRETAYLRSKILVDACAAGVPFPIGGGTTSRRDVAGARSFARENRVLGYSGVHCSAEPAIINAVNDELSPSSEEVDEWSALLPRLEEAERAGCTVAHLDGRVFDLVGLVRMREQLALARRLGRPGATQHGGDEG